MEKILIAGSLNMDVVVKVEDMPKVGETVLAGSLDYIPGGKGANQACAAGRLGGDVTMIGAVGKDQFADVILKGLEDAGVDVSGISHTGAPTGIALIPVDNKGNNSIIVAAGANRLCDLSYIELKKPLIESAGILITQMEIPEDAVYHAIKTAHGFGRKVILNPAPTPKFIPADIYPCIDYMTPNETELEALTGMNTSNIQDIADAAKMLIARGVKRVLVTCGSAGAVLVSSEGYEHCPSPVVNAVDTTGAGDCFNAAFAVALIEGKSEKDAIGFACSAAAISVTREGAQHSMPYRKEVEAFMRQI